jgi:protein TonB
VEEVAPESTEKAGSVTPNAFGAKKSNAVKGTNKDQNSLGKSPVAAKGKNPNPKAAPGTAGQGGTGGVGQGTGIPGLKGAQGIQGGTGLIGDLDADFPFLWYLQQVQTRITGNWNRMSSVQGRVQIYFRIRRDGALEGIRVEIPSGNAGLDQSAMLAVKRSDPLPRLPEGFEGQTLGVRFWFSYLGN